MISAVAPGWPEDGARRHTTVASTNGSPRADRSEAERERPPVSRRAAAWIASQTLAEVSGMSMFVTPSGRRASITAFT